MSMKNPMTPAGIEPATIRFVAQHLNHCATTVPLDIRRRVIPLASVGNQTLDYASPIA